MSLTVAELRYIMSADTHGLDRGLGQARRGIGGLKTFAVGALAAVTTAVVGVGTAAITTGIKTAAGLEQADIAFTTLLGSGRRAKNFLEDLKRFAATTPFELEGLVDNARRLLGVGVAAKDVLPTLTTLGDAAGALGLNQEQYNRALLAYSQALSKGTIQAEEMLQLTEAGIPAWKLLSEATGKSVSQLRDMGAEGKLLSKDVLPLLLKEMKKDYGGSMSKQAKTLTGLWSTLKDEIKLALAEAVEPAIPMLRKSLPKAADLAGDAIRGLSEVFTDIGNNRGFRQAVTFVTDFFRGLTTSTDLQFEKAKTRFGTKRLPVGRFVPDTRGEKAGATLRRLASTLPAAFEDAIKDADWSFVGDALADALIGGIEFGDEHAETLGKKFSRLIMSKEFWAGLLKTNVFAGMMDVIQGLGEQMGDWVVEGFEEGVGEGLLRLLNVFFPGITAIVDFTQGFLEESGRKLGQWIVDGFEDGFFEGMKRLIGLIYNPFVLLIDIVKDVLGVSSPSTVFHKIGVDVVQGLINGLLSKLPGAREASSLLGLAVRNRFKGSGGWLFGRGKSIVQGLIDGMQSKRGDLNNSVERSVSGVLNRWDDLRQTRSTVSFVVNHVMRGLAREYNQLARAFGGKGSTVSLPKFRGGGGVPGSDPKALATGGDVDGEGTGTSDSILAWLSKGEHVWTAAEVARAGGHRAVEWLRGQARRGSRVPGFAVGGPVGDMADLPMGAWMNPTGYLKRQNAAIMRSLSALPSTGFNNTAERMARKLSELSVSKLDKVFESLGGLGGASGPGGYRWQMAVLRSRFPGLPLISGFRPGARTLSGDLSWHGRGRAVDIPPRFDVFNWIRSVFGRNTHELIFTPAGRRQIYRGRPHIFSPGVAAMHWDHVHWAYDRGGLAKGRGLLPKLRPEPERVLNPHDTRVYDELLTQLSAMRLRGRSEPLVLRIVSDGRRRSELLLEELREAIRIEGGDVQVVLGRG